VYGRRDLDLIALDALAARDGAALLAIADELQSRSLSFDAALADLASLFLRVALAKTVPAALEADVPDRERLLAYASRFDAEEIQLYYQIAVQGRQDLPLAPDEHAGFSMTLLRMHAFRPEGAPASAKDTISVAGAAAGTARAALASQAKAASGPAAEVERRAVPGATFNGDWPALVRSLELGGAAKLLADNSELQRHAGGQFQLCVPKAMAYLAEKNYADKLKAALEQRFGGMVIVRVAVGDVQGSTIAAVEQGERDSRQAKAADAVRGDSFVRELVDIFDATVIDKTIQATPKGS